jgi:hypothetical protein
MNNLAVLAILGAIALIAYNSGQRNRFEWIPPFEPLRNVHGLKEL